MAVTLCEGCRMAIVTRFDNGAMLVRCTEGGGAPLVLQAPVTTCSEFSDRKKVDLYDMEKIAWRLATDKKDNEVGFRPPKRRDDD